MSSGKAPLPSPTTLYTFSSLSSPSPPLGILPHDLYPFHTRVKRANTARLATLPWAAHAFVARDTGKHQRVRERMVVPARLALKTDAQVMLAKKTSTSDS